MRLKCPECDSNDILVGNEDNPHHCGKCDHEWEPHDHEHDDGDSKEESLDRKLHRTLFDGK